MHAPRPHTELPPVPELLNGIELRTSQFGQYGESPSVRALCELIQNAEYWLSFGAAEFDPLLQRIPSPLRELGVAISLRFGARLDGSLGIDELVAAREWIEHLDAPALSEAFSQGLSSLERALLTRECWHEWLNQGYTDYKPTTTSAPHALRSKMAAHIQVGDDQQHATRATITVGEPVQLQARTPQGDMLEPPEIKSRADAPILYKTGPSRTDAYFILTVPGEYTARVPSRPASPRKILAR